MKRAAKDLDLHDCIPVRTQFDNLLQVLQLRNFLRLNAR
jgi:hypothetical protein